MVRTILPATRLWGAYVFEFDETLGTRTEKTVAQFSSHQLPLRTNAQELVRTDEVARHALTQYKYKCRVVTNSCINYHTHKVHRRSWNL